MVFMVDVLRYDTSVMWWQRPSHSKSVPVCVSALVSQQIVKPPRGASVMTEPVHILGYVKTPVCQISASKASVDLIEQRIDALLQEDDSDKENESDMDLLLSVDEVVDESQSENCILFYLRSYVAHKMRKFSSCAERVQLLTDTDHTSVNDSRPEARLVQLKSWGAFKMPSLQLMKLLKFLEQCIQNHSDTPCVDIYSKILNEALANDELAVGSRLFRTCQYTDCKMHSFLHCY